MLDPQQQQDISPDAFFGSPEHIKRVAAIQGRASVEAEVKTNRAKLETAVQKDDISPDDFFGGQVTSRQPSRVTSSGRQPSTWAQGDTTPIKRAPRSAVRPAAIAGGDEGLAQPGATFAHKPTGILAYEPKAADILAGQRGPAYPYREVPFNEPLMGAPTRARTFHDDSLRRQRQQSLAQEAQEAQAQANHRRQTIKGRMRSVIGSVVGLPPAIIPDVVTETAADIGGGLTSAVGSMVSGESKPSVFNPIKSAVLQIPGVQRAMDNTVGRAGQVMQEAGVDITEQAGAPDGVRRDVGRAVGGLLPILAARNPLAVGAVAYDEAKGQGADEQTAIEHGLTSAATVGAMGGAAKAVSRAVPEVGAAAGLTRFGMRAAVNTAAAPLIEAPGRLLRGESVIPTDREKVNAAVMGTGFALMPHPVEAQAGVSEPISSVPRPSIARRIESGVMGMVRPRVVDSYATPQGMATAEPSFTVRGKGALQRENYEAQRAAQEQDDFPRVPTLIKQAKQAAVSPQAEFPARPAPASPAPSQPAQRGDFETGLEDVNAPKAAPITPRAETRPADTPYDRARAAVPQAPAADVGEGKVTTVKPSTPRSRSVSPESDTLLAAIQKLGFDATTAEGSDLAKYLSVKEGGRPGMVNNQRGAGGQNRGIDDLVSQLQALGYPVEDGNHLLDLVRQEQQGKPTHSYAFDHAAKAENELQQHLSSHSEPVQQKVTSFVEGLRNHSEFAELSDKIAHGEATNEEAKRFAEIGRYELNIDPDALESFLEESKDVSSPQGRGAQLGVEGSEPAVSAPQRGAVRDAAESQGDVNADLPRALVPGDVEAPASTSKGTANTTDQLAKVSHIFDGLKAQSRETGQSPSSLVEDRIAQTALPGFESRQLTADDATLLRQMAARAPNRPPVQEQQQGLLDTAPSVESRQAQTAAIEDAQSRGAANAPLFEGVKAEGETKPTRDEFIEQRYKMERGAFFEETRNQTIKDLQNAQLQLEQARTEGKPRVIKQQERAVDMYEKQLEALMRGKFPDETSADILIRSRLERTYNDEYPHHSQVQPRTAEGEFDGPPDFSLAPEKIAAPANTVEGKAISLLHKEAGGRFFNDSAVKLALALPDTATSSEVHKTLQATIGNQQPDTHTPSLLQSGIPGLREWARANNLSAEIVAKIDAAYEKALGLKNQELGGRADDHDVIQRYRADLARKSNELDFNPLADPQRAVKSAVVLGYDLYRTAKDFGVWSGHMVRQLGEKVRPYLRGIWDGVKGFHDDERGFVRIDTPEFKRWFGKSEVVDERGEALPVYHGTNRNFDSFDASRSRSILNEQHQGDGFHFSPDPDVAAEYAGANRNQSLDKNTVYRLVDSKFPPLISRIFHNVVEHGYDAGWNNLTDKQIKEAIDYQHSSGQNTGDLLDIAEHVEGTKYVHGDSGYTSIWGGRKSLPDWVVDSLNAFGMQQAVPQENITPVYLKAEKLLVTDDPEAAKTARQRGYDGVKYTGEGTVAGEPEYVVFDPRQIKSATDNSGRFDPDSASLTDPPFIQKLMQRVSDAADKYEGYVAKNNERVQAKPGEGGFLGFGKGQKKVTNKKGVLVDEDGKLLDAASLGERVVLGFAKGGRQVLISSITTAEKLPMFGLIQQGVIAGQDLIGAGLRRLPLLKTVASRAPREGAGFNARAQAANITEFFSQWASLGKKGSEMRGYVKGRYADIDMVYGKEGERASPEDRAAAFKRLHDIDISDIQADLFEKGKQSLPPEAWEFIGRLHGMEKLPTRMGEFKRSMTFRLEKMAKQGEDATDPNVVFSAGADAYLDANRVAILNDNLASQLFSRIKGDLRELGYRRTAAVVEAAVPITRIPANYAAETIRYAGGGVAKALPEILWKGIRGKLNELDPARADLLMRNMKKGMVGPLLAAIAYAFPGIIQATGYKKKDESSDVVGGKPGTLKIFGYEVPKHLSHAPALEAMQLYATLRRLHDKTGFFGAAKAALAGTMQHVPYYEEPARAIEAVEGDDESTRQFLSNLLFSRVIPPDVRRAARIWDQPDSSTGKFWQFLGVKPEDRSTYRDADSLWQDFEVNVPGLRQNVRGIEPVQRTPGESAVHARATANFKSDSKSFTDADRDRSKAKRELVDLIRADKMTEAEARAKAMLDAGQVSEKELTLVGKRAQMGNDLKYDMSRLSVTDALDLYESGPLSTDEKKQVREVILDKLTRIDPANVRGADLLKLKARALKFAKENLDLFPPDQRAAIQQQR